MFLMFAVGGFTDMITLLAFKGLFHSFRADNQNNTHLSFVYFVFGSFFEALKFGNDDASLSENVAQTFISYKKIIFKRLLNSDVSILCFNASF